MIETKRQRIDEKDSTEILETILPKVMADLKRRSPTVREEMQETKDRHKYAGTVFSDGSFDRMKETTDRLTEMILDAAMPDLPFDAQGNPP